MLSGYPSPKSEQGYQKFGNPVHVDKELAKIARVSHLTMLSCYQSNLLMQIINVSKTTN